MVAVPGRCAHLLTGKAPAAHAAGLWGPTMPHASAPALSLPSHHCLCIPARPHRPSLPQAKRTKAALPVLHAARRTILLTGTPTLSRPAELLPQLQVGPGRPVRMSYPCCATRPAAPQARPRSGAQETAGGLSLRRGFQICKCAWTLEG
jgi:hypothetical protein